MDRLVWYGLVKVEQRERASHGGLDRRPVIVGHRSDMDLLQWSGGLVMKCTENGQIDWQTGQ